jgi:hypothetical protein
MLFNFKKKFLWFFTFLLMLGFFVFLAWDNDPFRTLNFNIIVVKQFSLCFLTLILIVGIFFYVLSILEKFLFYYEYKSLYRLDFVEGLCFVIVLCS